VVLTAARGGRAGAQARRLLAALLVLGCAGCASLPQQDIGPEPLDRFERVNRGIYRFNRGFDKNLARPIARVYDKVVPPRVERRFRNFFTNLRAPTDIANNWLQGKFKPGFSDLGRFLLNTVAGGGFFDPAAKLGLERHPEDFGQTLATWGVPPGGYFVMPFFGPGSVRDWSAWRVDAGTDPLWHVDDTSTRNSLLAWRLVSDRAVLLPAERVREESLDEYALVREAWFQRRRYELFDEAPPEDDDYLFLDSDTD
jgi:phospholipid-binding lipoprotein MlaA